MLWARNFGPPDKFSPLMEEPIPAVKTDSALVCYQTWIGISLLNRRAGILGREFAWLMCAVKCTLRTWVKAVCLSRARTATFASTGTQPLCARYRQGAISTFLTIRILRTFCPRQCIEDLRPCTSSQECAPFELALSRAGEQSTGARVSQAHHVGSSSVSTGPYSGWTKSLCKWPHPASRYTRSLKLLV